MKMLGENILIEPIVEKTAGSFYLPETKNKEKTTLGIVKAIGLGVLNADGSRTSIQVEVGDKVLFNTSFADDLQTMRVVNQKDILCIVKD